MSVLVGPRAGGLMVILVLMGIGWGITGPLAKIAVTGGLPPLGLVFWQALIAATLLGALNRARGRSLPRGRPAIELYLLIALAGSVLPGWASYSAARVLPAGIITILIACVPMLSFPIALALGTDRFSLVRLGGLALGLGGVALIALPEASLPGAGMALFLPLAMIAPLCYAVEGNGVALIGHRVPDAMLALEGGSIAAAILVLPLSLALGHGFAPLPPWGPAESALIALGLVNAGTYTAYVWMVGRAGAVFAAQVSYLVTGSGVIWAMALLGERYAPSVWIALVLMLGGLALVQPRPALKEPL